MGHLTMAAMSANDPKRTLRRLDHAGRVTVGLVADALFTSDALKLILIYFRFVRERTRTYSMLLAPTLGEVEMANKNSITLGRGTYQAQNVVRKNQEEAALRS